MPFALHEDEASALVDAAGGDEHVVRPQDELAVTGRASEVDTFVDEPGSDAEPARPRLHEQETKLRDVRRLLHAEDGPDRLTVELSDPAALALAIEVLDELRDDPGDKSLERFVPTVLLRVELTVAHDDPAHVAGATRAQTHLAWGCLARLERLLDRTHGADETAMRGDRQGIENRADLFPHFRIERCERAPTASREREQAHTRVARRRGASHEPPTSERAQHAAQVSGIDPEIARQIARRRPVPMRDLVQDADLS